MSLPNETLLLVRDLATRFPTSQLEALGQDLQQRLHQPVKLWIDQPDQTPLPDLVQSIAESNTRQITLLPLGLFPISSHSPIARTVLWAKRQWPDLEFQQAIPLTWIEIAGWLKAQTRDATPPSSRTGTLLVAQSTPNPMANAQLALLAQLLREGLDELPVAHAFLSDTSPTLSDAFHELSRAGSTSINILPWRLDGASEKDLHSQASVLTAEHQCPAQIIPLDLRHPALTNLLLANHMAAAPWTTTSQTSTADADESSLSPEDAIALQELDARINAMLPSEYQGSYESVSPQSMGSASVKYDEQGKVAWDQIWTSFCDLALAGGPPHRGTLLEAVTAEAANAEPEKYQIVVDEIGRGIQLVTGLSTVPSKSPGWVGVRCHGEEMAVWLMRAIIVENIMVRRERDTLYLPAGPHFTVQREIKNVITAVAKTVHYWTAHLKSRQAQ